MKHLISVLEVIYLRLRSKTPVFFRIITVIYSGVAGVAGWLNSRALSHQKLPKGISEDDVVWLTFIVFAFGFVIPFLTTKDEVLQKVKTDLDLAIYKKNKLRVKLNKAKKNNLDNE